MDGMIGRTVDGLKRRSAKEFQHRRWDVQKGNDAPLVGRCGSQQAARDDTPTDGVKERMLVAVFGRRR